MELMIETPEVFRPILGKSRYKGVYGGRGSGKSWFFAGLLIERCLQERTDCVCIRENQKSLQQSVKKLLETQIEKMGVGQHFTVQDKRILGPYGGLIIFEGMQNHTAESIKSLEGYDIAWVEEAQTLSQKSMDMLRPTLRKPGSELWFSWNPRTAEDPVDLLLRNDNPPPNAVVIKANYESNPWFPDVLRQEMEYDQKRDFDKYRHVWLGEYLQNAESRVFSNWRVEEFECPAGATIRQGADWGFSVDPSVLVRCWIIGRNLYIDHEVYMIGCEIDNLPSLFMQIPEAEKWPTFADSSNPQVISYMRNHGFGNMFAAVKGPNSIQEGIAFLQSYDIIVHPRCIHLIAELSTYSYKVDPQTDRVLPVLEDKNNHVIDALRYACEGVRRAQATKPAAATKPSIIHKPHGWMGN